MAVIDYIGASFWNLTYIIIAFTCYVNKNDTRIPIHPLTLWINFSWETASVIFSVCEGLNIFSRGHSIRFAWFFFDIFILWFFFKKNNFFVNKKRFLVGYLALFSVLTALFFFLFGYTSYGMPISSFVIDSHMAILFFIYRKQLDPCNRLIIGITKMLGDIFAGICYGSTHPTIVVLACISFFFNVLYVIYAVKERQINPNIDSIFIEKRRQIYKKIKIFLVGEKKYQKKRKYKKKKNKKTHIKKRKKV